MPHNRFDWASRIETAEREYHAVRVAVDWLLGATPDEIHDVINDDLCGRQGKGPDVP
jgi:hypothetical protein